MNAKRVLRLVAILCLVGLGLVGSGVSAQTTGFRLAWSSFSGAGTGAEPLSSEGFQMHASVGQTGPVGNASSASFGMRGGFMAVLERQSLPYAIYLPVMVKGA